jgi:methylaspartate ammonia-lyase
MFYTYNLCLRALAVAADAADGAAAFMFDNPAAIRTGALEEGALFMLHLAAVGL